MAEDSAQAMEVFRGNHSYAAKLASIARGHGLSDSSSQAEMPHQDALPGMSVSNVQHSSAADSRGLCLPQVPTTTEAVRPAPGPAAREDGSVVLDSIAQPRENSYQTTQRVGASRSTPSVTSGAEQYRRIEPHLDAVNHPKHRVCGSTDALGMTEAKHPTIHSQSSEMWTLTEESVSPLGLCSPIHLQQGVRSTTTVHTMHGKRCAKVSSPKPTQKHKRDSNPALKVSDQKTDSIKKAHRESSHEQTANQTDKNSSAKAYRNPQGTTSSVSGSKSMSVESGRNSILISLLPSNQVHRSEKLLARENQLLTAINSSVALNCEQKPLVNQPASLESDTATVPIPCCCFRNPIACDLHNPLQSSGVQEKCGTAADSCQQREKDLICGLLEKDTDIMKDTYMNLSHGAESLAHGDRRITVGKKVSPKALPMWKNDVSRQAVDSEIVGQEGAEDAEELYHKCLVCRKTFPTSDLLEDHLLVHIEGSGADHQSCVEDMKFDQIQQKLSSVVTPAAAKKDDAHNRSKRCVEAHSELSKKTVHKVPEERSPTAAHCSYHRQYVMEEIRKADLEESSSPKGLEASWDLYSRTIAEVDSMAEVPPCKEVDNMAEVLPCKEVDSMAEVLPFDSTHPDSVSGKSVAECGSLKRTHSGVESSNLKGPPKTKKRRDLNRTSKEESHERAQKLPRLEQLTIKPLTSGRTKPARPNLDQHGQKICTDESHHRNTESVHMPACNKSTEEPPKKPRLLAVKETDSHASAKPLPKNAKRKSNAVLASGRKQSQMMCKRKHTTEVTVKSDKVRGNTEAVVPCKLQSLAKKHGTPLHSNQNDLKSNKCRKRPVVTSSVDPGKVYTSMKTDHAKKRNKANDSDIFSRSLRQLDDSCCSDVKYSSSTPWRAGHATQQGNTKKQSRKGHPSETENTKTGNTIKQNTSSATSEALSERLVRCLKNFFARNAKVIRKINVSSTKQHQKNAASAKTSHDAQNSSNGIFNESRTNYSDAFRSRQSQSSLKVSSSPVSVKCSSDLKSKGVHERNCNNPASCSVPDSAIHQKRDERRSSNRTPSLRDIIFCVRCLTVFTVSLAYDRHDCCRNSSDTQGGRDSGDDADVSGSEETDSVNEGEEVDQFEDKWSARLLDECGLSGSAENEENVPSGRTTDFPLKLKLSRLTLCTEEEHTTRASRITNIKHLKDSQMSDHKKLSKLDTDQASGQAGSKHVKAAKKSVHRKLDRQGTRISTGTNSELFKTSKAPVCTKLDKGKVLGQTHTKHAKTSRVFGYQKPEERQLGDSHTMFQCDGCEQTFFSTGGLLFHQRAVHHCK